MQLKCCQYLYTPHVTRSTCVHFFHVTLSAFVHSSHVFLESIFAFKYTRADVTLERLDVTDAVNCSLVQVQTARLREPPAANVAFKPGVGMLRSGEFLRVRRVVVSVDC